MGTRFGEKTELMPKGFVPFKGKAMVIRSIETLLECGIERIIIGTGYHKEWYEALMKDYPQIECVFSPRYAETNSMYTLFNCREAIHPINPIHSINDSNGFILLESDLVFEKRAIQELINCEYDSAMLITPVTKFQDQYYVEMDENKVLVNCSTNKEELVRVSRVEGRESGPSGELVGIHKLSYDFYRTMCDEYAKIVESKPKLGYEYQLLWMSQHIMPMNVLRLDGLQWYEIDDVDDLKFAETNIDITGEPKNS